MLRRIAKGSLLALVSVLASLLLAEGVLTVAGVSYPSFFVVDPEVGMALRPGAAGWQRSEGTAYVEINSRGLRDREHELIKPAGAFRIAVLGDSYTYASQVALKDTFWAIVERNLGGCETFEGRTVEALNFGVSGYGTAHSLLTLRHRVWDYAPDLVVLAFFTGNDITDNSYDLSRDDRTPYFHLDGDQLMLDRSYLEDPGYRFRTSGIGRIFYAILDHSRLLQVANRAMIAIRTKARIRDVGKDLRAGPLGIEAGIDSAIYGPPKTPRWTEAWRLTERLLETFHEEVESHGSEFLVVTLSTAIQVHPDSHLRSDFMTELEIDDIFYPDLRLRDFASSSGIPLLVLAPAFQEYALSHQVALHGFANSRLGFGHWNEKGHRLAGEMLADHLCAQSSVLQPGPDQSPDS